jgi:hypothetical protein
VESDHKGDFWNKPNSIPGLGIQLCAFQHIKANLPMPSSEQASHQAMGFGQIRFIDAMDPQTIFNPTFGARAAASKYLNAMTAST